MYVCVCGRGCECRRKERVRMAESNILLGQTSGIICKMKEATKFVIMPLKSSTTILSLGVRSNSGFGSS